MSKVEANNVVADSATDYGLSPVLSVAEVAAFLGVNAKTVYVAISEGQLPARRIGRRRVVILRDALLRWLASEERVVPERRGR